MKTIKQPLGSALCGAACVAMLIGQDLPDVMQYTSQIPESSPWRVRFEDPTCMTLSGMLRCLADNNYLSGLTINYTPSIPGDFTELSVKLENIEKFDAFVTVESETYKGGVHVVVWDANSECVRDPNPQKPYASPLDDYKIIQWVPVQKILPEHE